MVHDQNARRARDFTVFLLTGCSVINFPVVAKAQVAPTPATAPAAATPDASTQSSSFPEIVVTAQHRRENLLKVPIAISAVTAESLAQTGIDATQALNQIIPSVQFQRAGPSGLFFVRGVGTSNAAPGEEGATAFYVDGVYLPDLGQTINNFNNIERIEVLKGPQGTLFGRNAFGGLVNVITREPGDHLVVDGELSYGNYDTVGGKLYVAGPLRDNLSMDFAFTGQHQNDGWGRNLTLDKPNQLEDWEGYRSKLVYKPGSAIKITLTGYHYWDYDTTGPGWRILDGYIGTGGYGSPGGHDTLSNNDPFARTNNWGTNLTGEVDLGFATLTALGALSDSKIYTDLDVEAGPLNILNIDYHSGTRAYQAEVRLASKRTTPFSWQVGGFYLKNHAYNQSLFFGSVFGKLDDEYINSAQNTNSYAGFGEATYDITRSTHLTGGVRYTEDRRQLVGTEELDTPSPTPIVIPTSGRQSYNAVTWRAALRQDLSETANLYASVNRGFKAGEFNLQSPTQLPVQPEFITAYEAGLKAELLDRKLRLTISYFHDDISNYQVRSAAGSATGSSQLLNAASAKIDGVEAEFDAQPVQNLRVFGGATWLNARYGTFGGPGQPYQAPFDYAAGLATCNNGTANPVVPIPGGVATGGLGTCYGIATGNKLAVSPSFVGTLGSSVTVPLHNSGTLRFSGLFTYNSDYYFDVANYYHQPSFVLINSSVEYRPVEHWGIEVWGKNLLNTSWLATVNSTGTGPYAALAAPRTFGMTVKFNY